jgi:hypothetical protein
MLIWGFEPTISDLTGRKLVNRFLVPVTAATGFNFDKFGGTRNDPSVYRHFIIPERWRQYMDGIECTAPKLVLDYSRNGQSFSSHPMEAYPDLDRWVKENCSEISPPDFPGKDATDRKSEVPRFLECHGVPDPARCRR